MSTNRSRRIDRDAAEQLLAGATDGTQGGSGALRELLAAAAAPGTARELSGEEAAVTAFREAAQLASTSPALSESPSPSPSSQSRSSESRSYLSRSRPMTACVPQRFRVPTRFLGAKAAVAALAVTAIGGVAVAAGTGHLPVILGGSGHSAPTDNVAATGSVSASPTDSRAGQGRSARPSGGPTSGRAAAKPLPGGGSGSASGAASAGASAGAGSGAATGGAAASGPSDQAGPSGQAVPGASGFPSLLLPLCHLWPGDGQPGTTDSRFEPLTRAAGGSDRVRAYCAALPGNGGSGGQDSPSSPSALDGKDGKGTPGASPAPVRSPDGGRPSSSPPGGDGHSRVPQGWDSGGDTGHGRQ
ncbi:hypothetical protein [Kitasatospora kifunensis]|uniref:Uncharacterized protein n=1 Tax=Kitasatospora kifunensis TaxID=58351 RepID=A0A7W7VY50_KITKI|nr:hypothetical protein [Kitasatospora kifunensis]MBB4926668.1 hypothetical protein [Kitasatospora kifunensis]